MIEFIDECESTNDLLKLKANEGAQHGDAIVAARQTLGKGRQGRAWVSELGGLYLSVLIEPAPIKNATWIPLRVGAIVARHLSPAASIYLKWPNDLLTQEEKKLGGILCESIGSKIVVGLGMNVDAAPNLPQTGMRAASLREIASQTYDIQQLARDLQAGIANETRSLDSEWVAETRSLYERFSLFKVGDRISWGTDGNEGQYKGLGDLGQLVLETDKGSTQEIFADDVHLAR